MDSAKKEESKILENFDVGTVKKSNLYESVADTLEALILQDTLKVGDRLPSEAAMAESFGVSRNIIREAMKILKERHLVELRNGDGARVIKPDTNSLKDVISRMVVMGSIALPQIYEIRKALEVSASGLAALRSTPEQVDALYHIIDEMWENRNNREKWIKLDLDFHAEIASASGNPLFYEFIKSLSAALEQVFDMGYRTPGAVEKSVLMHREIVNAIRKKEPEEAEERMREHLLQSTYDSSFDEEKYKIATNNCGGLE